MSYTYCANVLAHTGGANELDDFALTVKDANNQTGATPCAWHHGHDAHGSPDTNSITEDAVPNTVTGSVLTGAGADGSQDGALSVASVNGTAVSGPTTINGLYGSW